jgi:NAD(P)-dependent dehydrogenase (short-subunit alcohol dehydrogenase family)
MNFAGKRIVVTGVASGIGRECAKLFRDAGAYVIGFDRHSPDNYVDEFIQVDLLDVLAIDRAVAAFDGGVDALCNIAGVPPTAPPITVVTVNFIALRYFTESMIPKLNDGASIVNLASLAGMGWPDALPSVKRFIETGDFSNVATLCDEESVHADRSYFLSKEALVVWTMKNWNTWRDRGIRINAVSPGPVDTPILGDFIETLGERAEEDMRVMGHAGRPEDIAQVVAFLCSDNSRWVNGANLPVDGGNFAYVQSQLHDF